MDTNKRTFDSSANITKSKMKEMEEVAARLSNARASLEGTSTESHDTPTVQFPVIKQSELVKVLPRYTMILARTGADGVKMKDLDQIQQELEKLLSTCAVRQRELRSEMESLDKEERKEKRGKTFEKASPVKRRKVEEKPRNKNACNILRILKIKQTVPPSTSGADVDKTKIPLIPKNDTIDRFWLSVDAYCQDVTQDNMHFLNELINECSQELDVKIPALGEHYATEWSEHGLQNEQNHGCITADSLQEEKAIASFLFTRVLDKFKSGEYIKGVNGIKNGLCLERRLRRDGILDVEDLSKSISREDEILQEIKKCQKELETVNQHNLTELNKLRDVVQKDLRKQEVKSELEKVDREVLNMYEKVLTAKQNQQDLTEFEAEANTIIRQQVYLHKELTGLTDLSLLDNSTPTN